MKQLVVFLTVVALSLAACGKSDGVPDLSKATPGEEVTLSELSLDFFPQSVVPYGTEPALAFTDLELTQKGDFIYGKVNFTRQGQNDFTLVVYLDMSDELLIGYLDAEQNLILNLPGRTGLVGTQGYQFSGNETGSIEFSLTAKVFGGFNVTGGKGTAYVFSVPGTVNSQTDPGTYQANSNLIEMEFDF